jgi:cell division protease FtsH
MCLVSFKDGTVASAQIPANDWRIVYAMENHGVTGHRITKMPRSKEEIVEKGKPMTVEERQKYWTIIPWLMLGMIYGVIRYLRQSRADYEDRKQMMQAEARQRDNEKKEIEILEAIASVPTMANNGMSADSIEERLASVGVDIGVDITRETIEAEIEKASKSDYLRDVTVNSEASAAAQELARRRFEEKRQKEMEDDDPNAKMEQFGKSVGVKRIKGINPEMAKKRRERKRLKARKGLKMQFLDEDDVFFDDVAGIGDAKVELMEVVDFFTKPEKFRSSGAKIPRGVLLCGPPGTGKTLLARAVAGEAGCEFRAVNASTFVEMFVGVGAARMRDLFMEARSAAPCILFIDEIDAVGRIRGGQMGNDERDSTLNQLLTEMDGFEQNDQIIVIAATNRKDVLDPALIRPGRFDRSVYVPLPDYYGRMEILNVHLSKRDFDADTVDLHEVSLETNQFSGAQLANLVNLAAAKAGREGRGLINQDDLMNALEEERLGPERTAAFSGQGMRRLAIVEAATAVACCLMPAIEPVQYVTIVPREKHPMGHTVVLANEPRELTQVFTRRYLEEQMLTLLAPRAAEQAVYGADGVSTMQLGRIELARRIANKLVLSNNMIQVDGVGPRTLSYPFYTDTALGQLVAPYLPADVHESADRALEQVLKAGVERAEGFVERNMSAISAVADALVEKKTLSGDEVRSLVGKFGDTGDLEARDALAGMYL